MEADHRHLQEDDAAAELNQHSAVLGVGSRDDTAHGDEPGGETQENGQRCAPEASRGSSHVL